MQSDCIRKASKACFNTCCAINPLALPPPSPATSTATSAADSRRSFVSAILSSIQPNTNFTNHESLPPLPQLISSLKNAVPNYLNTALADVIRDQEYAHLSLSNRVFLDYIGHGLFSLPQKGNDFEVCYTSANQESEFEKSIRERIMRYMNVETEDYSSVFTADESSAFKIIAESYPFYSHPNLVTVYDHENDAVEGMIARGRGRGARPHTASFSWPNLKINSRELRKIVVGKSKGRRNRGIFVFPLQSRTSGARYPYQWMNLARENGWHVLLDASALGAKDMETLGLSIFKPDFIICSFFKIFGMNPSGFCCLFIKKSCLADLSQSRTSIGIVRINPPSDKSAIDDESQELQFEQNEASCSEIIEVDDSRIECRAVTKSAIDEFEQDASCSGIIQVDEPRIEFRAQFEDKEAETVEFRAEFEDKETEIVEFWAGNEDKEAEIVECRAEIEDKEAEIVECRAEIEDKEAEIVECRAEIEDKEAEIVECRAEIEDKEAEIVECRAEIEDKESEIVECGAEFEDKEAEIVECRAEIEDKEAEIVECRAEIEDKEAEIAECRAEIEDKQSEIVECGAEFEDKEAEIVECRAKIEDNVAEIVECRTEIEDKGAEIVECRAKFEHEEAEIVKCRAEFEHKEAEIVECRAEIEDKEAEIVECRAGIEDKEAKIVECRALDHADTLGLILISSRVRYLVNWLVNALLSLKHPHSGNGLPLVAIYGPRIKLDRGPAIAFNVYDWKGERVDPILVQKLADRNNISLSLGFLKNICFSQDFQEKKSQVLENRGPKSKKRSKGDCGIRVVSVSLVMLSNFEDIYRVWAFVSRFLDADFVEKERWRYTALNQTTVEV